MTDIETISRSLESVFSAWKSQEISPLIEQFDILHSAIDTIGKLLFFPQEGRIAISELEQRLAGLMAGESVDMPDHKPLQPRDEAPPPKVKKTEVEEKKYEYPVDSPPETIAPISQHYPSAEEKPAMIETIRISTAKLDNLLLQAEEMLTAKITLSQRSEDFWHVLSMLDQWNKEWAKIYPEIIIIRYSLEKEQKGMHQLPLLESISLDTPNLPANVVKSIGVPMAPAASDEA
jgi:two-component system chemotaxis sensor kinase CheA